MKRIALLLIAVTVLCACAAGPKPSTELKPPVAERIPYSETHFRTTLSDPYHWLKDKARSDEKVLEYVEAENAYAAAWMEPLKSLEDTLFNEIIARTAETDLSVPDKRDDYYYYSRQEEGLQYPILCRRHGSMDAPEEVVLDENVLAEGHEYFAIGSYTISPDNRLLAYGYDTTADEVYTVVIRDIATGAYMPDTLQGASDVTWAMNNQTLYYTTDDEAGRSDHFWRHTLGQPVTDDELLFTEPDERFYIYSFRTASDKYVVMGTGSKTTCEMWVLPADQPLGKFTCVQPRIQGMEYYIDHSGDQFYITTNAQNAPTFKVMRTQQDSLSMDCWHDFIPWRDSVTVDCVVARDWLAVPERVNGLRKLHIINLLNGEEHVVEMPESDYMLEGVYFTDYEDETLRFSYTSLVTPRSLYEYNCRTRELTLLKQQVVNGYDPSLYRTERLWATAPDGVHIPITVVYRTDLFREDGTNPLYLEGYGAYGDPTEPIFYSAMLSLVNRGFVYALAHVRGGGDMGEHWYEDGRMFNKPNTFKDFIACGEYLVSAGYTSPDRMVGYGASAGGLLIGAVTNLRPDLFRVIIADVPFVDVLNTMMDPSLSATVSEYEEWGNPNVEAEFRSILSYCPYQNVSAQAYPAMFVLAGYYDPRVNYWEPAKWVAKIRYTRTNDEPLLLTTDMSGGHMGASGRYDFFREIAREYAFVLHELNMK